MQQARSEHGSLPQRDLIVLPLISLLTLIALLGIAEVAARIFFVASGSETCSRAPGEGLGMRPNCVSHSKPAEGPEVEMAYNDCGYRNPEPCGPKPASTIRLALLGASDAQGFKVPYKATFAARTSAALTRRCGRPVEIQNMGVAAAKPLDTYLRTDEALALRPDLVLWVMMPNELQERDTRSLRGDGVVENPPAQPTRGDAPGPQPRLLQQINTLADTVITHSRAVLVAEHFLFQDPEHICG